MPVWVRPQLHGVFKPRPIGELAVDEMYYTILMSNRFGDGGILESWLRAYASHRTGSMSAV